MTLASPGEPHAYLEWGDHARFALGPVTIYAYGVLFAAGLGASYLWLRWLGRREQDAPREAVRLFFGLVIGIFVGSRLGHILFYDDVGAYLADPARIFRLSEGGLASHGGAAGVLLATAILARSRRVPLRLLTDRAAFTLPTMGIFVRLGNLFNSEIVGRPTDVPWAIVFLKAPPPDPGSIPADLSASARAYLPAQVPRHPSQLYEVAMNFVILVVLYLVYRWYRTAGRPRPLGLTTGLVLTLYGVLRIGLEAFKAPQGPPFCGLATGQWLSIPFLLGGIGCLWAALRHSRRRPGLTASGLGW